MTTLRTAAASVDITPPPGGMMDGYGSRLSPSQGVHDPLFARVLVLDCGDAACAIVGCDVLGVHPWLTAELRRRVSASLGIAEDGALLAATHNHAGPSACAPACSLASTKHSLRRPSRRSSRPSNMPGNPVGPSR